MFMPRAAGAILIAYALFNVALGLNRDQLPWMLSGLLLMVAGLALLLPRDQSRALVFGAAAAAAAIGLISQFSAAQSGGEFVSAGCAWLVWSSLWISTAWVGARYLPPGGTPGPIRTTEAARKPEEAADAVSPPGSAAVAAA